MLGSPRLHVSEFGRRPRATARGQQVRHAFRRNAVQGDALRVRILCPKAGELLREHMRQKKGRREMKAEDRPEKTPQSTVQLLSRECNGGESIGIVCQAIHHADQETGVRKSLGVLSLVKKHGAATI